MKIKAKAKINLFLHVNNKLDTGYHELQSLVCFADEVYDEIYINKTKNAPKTTLISSEFATKISGQNILDKINQLKIFSWQYDFKILKNIPVAAGLGGGSSDAAVTLNKLIEHERILLTTTQITEICRIIGSDVLVCLKQEAAYFGGIGDQITPLMKTFPKLYILLVNPRIAVTTKDIFQKRKAMYTPYLPFLQNSFNNEMDLISFLQNTRNDLQKDVLDMYPILTNMLNALVQSKNCLIARMSGSGATFFGLYKNKADAEQASSLIGKEFPNYWIKTSSIS